MEFRGVPERARRAERQIVWIWHLNTHGVNLGRDTLGNDIRKAGLFGDPAKGTLLFVDKHGECLPHCSKVRTGYTLFLTHLLLDRPPECVVDFSPDWTVPVLSRLV